MIDSWQTFGHHQAKKILGKQLQNDTLSQSYLFLGPEGIGKKMLALELAKKILYGSAGSAESSNIDKDQVNLSGSTSPAPTAVGAPSPRLERGNIEKLYSHPDFLMLDLGAEEIPVASALDFLSKTAFKPFVGAKKVAIINNSENLNLQSGNALLKTLEEPSESSVIILVANSRQILPTIMSRCQVLNFSPIDNETLAQFAQAENLKISPEILALSFGKISRLKKLHSDEAYLLSQKMLVEEYRQIAKLSRGERLLKISELAEKETDELVRDFIAWLNWQAGELFSQPKEFYRLQVLTDALAGLAANFNKKLVLQKLVLKI